MIKSITVMNYLGDTITMDMFKPEESGFIIAGIKGLGPAKANINTTDMASIDGALYNSSRMGSRNIVLTLCFSEEMTEKLTIEELRQLTYKYFPVKQDVTLTIETDERKVEIEGYVESNEPNIFSSRETTQISIICPDPYFYSIKDDDITETYFGALMPMFEFPFMNNSITKKLILMGDIRSKRENTIYYGGDIETGVIIDIFASGRVENITIYNIHQREVMKIDTDMIETLTGSGIVSGDQIRICTLKGKKSITLIRGGVYTNILNCVDKDVDWFHLVKGDNIFTYTCTFGEIDLKFFVYSQIIYEGI